MLGAKVGVKEVFRASPQKTTIVRYIGHPRMEVNAPFLAEWAHTLGQWLLEGKTVYSFCHCPFEEHSPAICSDFYQPVKAVAPLPALPWSEPQDKKPAQARLF